MKFKSVLATAVAAAAIMASGQALAASNNPPPAGPVIFNLDGQPLPTSGFVNYTVNFTATSALTNLSFAFREDPAFLQLDNVSLTDLTAPSGELVVNGDFESGSSGPNTPTGWSYLNIFGASFAGVVSGGCGIAGSACYNDGAVQAYDAISQAIATNSGDLYHLSFWLADNGSPGTASALSTNGNVTDTGGNGRNLVVYGGALPTPGVVPEPTTWALMIAGFGGLGAALRRRRALALA